MNKDSKSKKKIHTTPNEYEVLKYMVERGGTVPIAEIGATMAIRLDTVPNAINQAISDLRLRGIVKRTSRGIYAFEEDLGEYECSVGSGYTAQSENEQGYVRSNKIASVMNNALDRIITIRSKPMVVKPVRSDKETAVIFLSDLHIGQRTLRDEEVVYNSEIALSRLQTIAERFVKVLSLAAKGASVDEVVLLLGGDIIDGDCVYDGHAFEIDAPAFKQMQSALNPVWNLAVAVAESFPSIKSVRIEGAPGNHGRAASKGSNGCLMNNWDRLLFVLLQTRAMAIKKSKITVSVPTSDTSISIIKGHRLMCKHVCPRYIETPAGRNRIAGYFVHHRFEIACFGHWHDTKYMEINETHIFRNGSPAPANEYAQGLGLVSEPSQWMFGVGKDQQPTYMYPIRFDKKGGK